MTTPNPWPEDTFPYPVDDKEAHPLAWVFFYAAGLSMSMDAASDMARHVFDDLGCGAPGTDHEPTIKYDGLGGSGAPWEPGMWIPVDEERMTVTATAPDVEVTAMTDAERAELRAALDAAEDVARVRKAEENRVFDGVIVGDTTGHTPPAHEPEGEWS